MGSLYEIARPLANWNRLAKVSWILLFRYQQTIRIISVMSMTRCRMILVSARQSGKQGNESLA